MSTAHFTSSTTQPYKRVQFSSISKHKQIRRTQQRVWHATVFTPTQNQGHTTINFNVFLPSSSPLAHLTIFRWSICYLLKVISCEMEDKCRAVMWCYAVRILFCLHDWLTALWNWHCLGDNDYRLIFSILGFLDGNMNRCKN